MSAEDFEAVYGDYCFESIFEGRGDLELCQGGKDKKLSKENAGEYI